MEVRCRKPPSPPSSSSHGRESYARSADLARGWVVAHARASVATASTRVSTAFPIKGEQERAMSTAWDAWNYRDSARGAGSANMVGYHVHAVDGDIGKIDEASNDVGGSRVVVDTGPW